MAATGYPPAAEDNQSNSHHHNNNRLLPVDNITRLIKQDGSRHLGCDESSGWIWHAGRVLAAHLLRHLLPSSSNLENDNEEVGSPAGIIGGANLLDRASSTTGRAAAGPGAPNGVRILELGSGTGWLALTLAREIKGSAVVATERRGAMSLLTRNVYGCLERMSYDEVEDMDISVEELHWEDESHRVSSSSGGGEFDLIVGSDLFYLKESYESLLNTIVRHTERRNKTRRSTTAATTTTTARTATRCIFTWEERKPEEEALFLLLAEGKYGFSFLPPTQVDVNEATGNPIWLVDMVYTGVKKE